MKYLRKFEGGNNIYSKESKYKEGDYIVVNDPKRQIYNEILRIDDVSSYIGSTYFYNCSIANDFGDYDNGLQIRIGNSQIKRKLSKKEVDFLLDVKKYNL